MAVSNADERLTIIFRIGLADYTAKLKRGQIVHEAFHAALPKELTVGHRLTFRTPAGAEVFADSFLGDVADHPGPTT
jgi:hypothetical protein